jgi:hypothetical protein
LWVLLIGNTYIVGTTHVSNSGSRCARAACLRRELCAKSCCAVLPCRAERLLQKGLDGRVTGVCSRPPSVGAGRTPCTVAGAPPHCSTPEGCCPTHPGSTCARLLKSPYRPEALFVSSGAVSLVIWHRLGHLGPIPGAHIPGASSKVGLVVSSLTCTACLHDAGDEQAVERFHQLANYLSGSGPHPTLQWHGAVMHKHLEPYMPVSLCLCHCNCYSAAGEPAAAVAPAPLSR